ncbi:MAG: hypothetical protein GY850_33400 [bacterium]|nr:hypothetical protein [bacterium]
MGEDRKELKQEKYPNKLLQTAPANSTNKPPAAVQEQGRHDRTDSAPGSGKMVDLAELKENESAEPESQRPEQRHQILAQPDGGYLRT